MPANTPKSSNTFDRPIFVCHVCQRARYIHDVGVVATTYRLTHNPAITWKENVRFCKDSTDCLVGAKLLNFGTQAFYESTEVVSVDVLD